MTIAEDSVYVKMKIKKKKKQILAAAILLFIGKN